MKPTHKAKKEPAKQKITSRRRSLLSAQEPAGGDGVAPKPVPDTPAPVSATLSHEASELVRWYCGVTHHAEGSAVEGAVYGVLERAKDAYEGPPGGDDGFDWLLTDVLAGMNDDSRQSHHRQHGGGFTQRLNGVASELLWRYLRESTDDPRDVVSGCVISLLRCQLDDLSLDLRQAVQQAKEGRLAEEDYRQRRNAATVAARARKDIP